MTNISSGGTYCRVYLPLAAHRPFPSDMAHMSKLMEAYYTPSNCKMDLNPKFPPGKRPEGYVSVSHHRRRFAANCNVVVSSYYTMALHHGPTAQRARQIKNNRPPTKPEKADTSRPLSINGKFSFLIMDEAHQIRNVETLQWRTMYWLRAPMNINSEKASNDEPVFRRGTHCRVYVPPATHRFAVCRRREYIRTLRIWLIEMWCFLYLDYGLVMLTGISRGRESGYP
jgi:hypothetical protein